MGTVYRIAPSLASPGSAGLPEIIGADPSEQVNKGMGDHVRRRIEGHGEDLLPAQGEHRCAHRFLGVQGRSQLRRTGWKAAKA